MALLGRYTLFAEGARGHLGKQLIADFNLASPAQPQHYAIGFKELWQLPAGQGKAGQVLHGSGWPLGKQGAAIATAVSISITWRGIRWQSG